MKRRNMRLEGKSAIKLHLQKGRRGVEGKRRAVQVDLGREGRLWSWLAGGQ